MESGLEAQIGMSRKWDAREAGREVARSTIEKLNHPPDFFLLFSTIHYEKHGGFQELLEGVYDILPPDTPLIGGTVTGFANNYGIYARGTTGLAVSSSEMDVAVGYGRNTKRSPKRAARHCAKMIKESLKHSSYENKFLFNFISAAEIPNIYPLGRKKIIREGIAIRLIMQLFNFSQYILQKGSARDDEVIEEMIKFFPDFCMLGGGAVDDGSGFTNYQFYNKKVLTNSIVSLGVRSKHNFDVKTTHNMKKTGIKFKITKTSRDGRIIHKINGKPAATEILKLLDWPADFLNDKTWFKITYHFPLGFHINSEKLGPRVIVGIFGEYLITTIRSKDSDAYVLTIDGNNLLQAIDDNLESLKDNPKFGLISSCSTRLVTMGDKIYKAKERIQKYFGDSPFIALYVGGESTYSPDKGLNFVNMSFNTLTFYEKRD